MSNLDELKAAVRRAEALMCEQVQVLEAEYGVCVAGVNLTRTYQMGERKSECAELRLNVRLP